MMYGISLAIVYSCLILSTFCLSETGTIIDQCRDVVFNCKCGISGYVFQAVFKQCHYWLPPEQACTRYQHCLECQTGMRKCLACPTNRYGEQCAGVNDSSSTVASRRCRSPTILDTAIRQEFEQAGTIIKFSCIRDYFLVGSETLICINGRWNGVLPKCVKIEKPYCERPKEIPFGGMQMETPEIQTDQFNTVFPVRSVISYFCSKHHELVGVSNQTCLDTGEWSAQQPKCVSRSELEKPSTTNNSLNDESPWQIAIGTSRNIITCVGVLLSNDWVITGAHCLASESGETNKSQPELKVYIGLLQSDVAAEFVEEKSVKRIIFHPDYDSISAYSNIALISLEEPISARIEPVLLTRKSFSHLNVRVGRVGMAISWKKGSDDYFSGVLEGRNLTVLSSDDCSKLHRNKIGEIPEFSNNTFCAGFPNKELSVCGLGNGGFIVFPVSYGEMVLWYLEGIMKWKCEGGKEGGFYGGFTRIVNFLPWIEDYVNL